MVLSLEIVGQNKKVNLAEEIFAAKFNESLIHQIVTAYMAGGRAGTKAQKTRSDVRGGGRKPWKQKGSGNARAGTSRSPIWRGGGVTFAARPRDYSQKVNKKMYRGAMRSIFAELYRQGRLVLVNEFVLESNKTKELAKKFKDLSLDHVLLITDNIDENLYMASRNLPKVQVMDVVGINPVDLVHYEKVLVTVAALKQIEEKFK